MKNKNYKLSTVLFALGAFSALLLMIFRVTHVISFSEIRHVVTSGFEEESLYAMWKFVHTMPVYTDPHQIPYSASYFNWFFYTVYGSLISLIIEAFKLGDAWIPTIGRCVSLILAGIGYVVTYRLFVNKHINESALSSIMALSLSALIWFSPLIGFWSMTVRPDLMALLFDICAVSFFLRYFPSHQWIGIFWAAFWCYLSWSCKQVNIVMPVAIGLFLLFHKRGQALFLFGALMAFTYGITLLFANEQFLKTLLFINTANEFSAAVFCENLLNFCKKALPVIILWFLIVAQLLWQRSVKELWQDNMINLSICGLLAWALIMLPFSSKVGSADNYHFLALFFMVLGIAGGVKQLLLLSSKWLSGSLALVGMLCITSIAIVFAQGNINTLSQLHQKHVMLENCLHQLPQPIFVYNHYAALPWINPSPISFVLAYNYWQDRNAQLVFEQNGIGGLIQQGYFNTVIIPKYYINDFDGAPLKAFTLQSQDCAGFAVFKRESA
ncbi:MAG: hypothetical protein JSS07_10935 [Proteobacteria bacterium]|nr:hypothetical protein [Pseudomonadota bacterium]